MLEQLESVYRKLIDHERLGEDEAQRLLSVVEDLRWYAGRIGVERWDKMPRSNNWSFEQNVWQLVRQAKNAAPATSSKPVWYWIDRGKVCVGLAAEIVALFEYREAE